MALRGMVTVAAVRIIPGHTRASSRRTSRMSGFTVIAWLVAMLLVCTVAAAAPVAITIEGLDDTLKQAALANLSLQKYSDRELTRAQLERMFQQSETQISKALEPYGYYNVRIKSDLQEANGKYVARFTVTPGSPAIVQESKVVVQGDGLKRRSVQRAVERFKPSEGERLDHGQYEASKGAVESALFNSGYLKAKANKRRVEVSRAANSATIDLEWDSGPRFRFGKVRFSESQFDPDFLQRFIPWEPEEYYSPDQLLNFQQRLVDADYFASVSALPNVDESQDNKVPIDVVLTPAKRSVYTAGVFMSTDTGPGVRVGLDRRWVNRRGHKLTSEISFAQRLQEAASTYKIPMPGRHDRSFNFGATYRDEDTESTKSRTARFATNETRQWHKFTRTLGLQYIAGDFEVADETANSNVLFAEGTLSRKEANNLSFPRRGYSMAFTTRFAPESPATDTSFTQVTADGKWIRTVARRQRVLLRASVGGMWVDDFNALPPELRFFAGGDRSIRGFDYQALGTTNAAGKVIGGEFLAVASAEYEYYFMEKWGAAVFVDGGDAFRTGEFDPNIGAGIGARWRSPVGIVRVDIAAPVQSDLETGIRVHISLGPDL